jgi:hypothetical protein
MKMETANGYSFSYMCIFFANGDNPDNHKKYCRGFAGGAFIAEHSYSNSSRPIAHARPDSDDIEKAQAFGFKIREKLKAINALEDLGKINIPGNSRLLRRFSRQHHRWSVTFS